MIIDRTTQTKFALLLYAPREIETTAASLLRALTLPVFAEVVKCTEPGSIACDSVIRLDLPESQPDPANSAPDVPIFTIKLLKRNSVKEQEVLFSNSRLLPPLLRGKRIVVDEPSPDAALPYEGEVLASIDGRPVWTTRSEGGIRHDTLLQALPWVEDDDRLFEHVKGRHFFRLVPIIEWLRSISDWGQWKKPPPRACFMFDDPNLHALSYGHLSFPTLARQGCRHPYHTSFATIPIDQYYVNPKAARLFRQCASQLSLLVHGNDHIHRELDHGEPPSHQAARIRQVLARVQKLEVLGGVRVARVMAPPHGAFSTSMMRACAEAGFEAACVSWGSIWSSNRELEWTRRLGADAGAVVEGLPILPRFRLAEGIENQILLSAYLEQPIIPVGHHWDVADGIDLLSHLADFINGLGEVRWENLTSMARTNYWWREAGDVLEVRPFSRRFDVYVPEGFRCLELRAPWLEDGFTVRGALVGKESAALPCEKMTNDSWSIPVAGPCKVAVSVDVGVKASGIGEGVRLPAYSVGPLLRRVLAESRDRLMPMLPRSFQRK